MPLAVVDIVAQSSGAQPPHLSQHPLALGFINIMAFSGAIAFGLFLNRMYPRQAFRWVSVPALAWVGMPLAVLGAALIASEIDNLFRWVLPPPRWLQELMEQLLIREGQLFSRIFLLVIVAPVTEELLFRGIILRGFLARYRVWLAILLSGFLFACIHLNPWQFNSALLLGAIFGWFLLRTGSVAFCILAHAVANGLVILVMALPVQIPGLTTVADGSQLQLQPWWLDLSAVALLLVGLWMCARSTRLLAAQPLLEIAVPPPIPSPITPSVRPPLSANPSDPSGEPDKG